jgi:hypothetical protein
METVRPYLKIFAFGVDGLAVEGAHDVGFLAGSHAGVAGALLGYRYIGRRIRQFHRTVLSDETRVAITCF